MQYLTVPQVIELHRLVVNRSGGASGLRDPGALESSVAQPAMTFGGVDLYPTLAAKAAALGYLLVANHPFVDGNKRVGHAAMEVMLVLNGSELQASVDEQERVVMAVAAGLVTMEAFSAWVAEHMVLR